MDIRANNCLEFLIASGSLFKIYYTVVKTVKITDSIVVSLAIIILQNRNYSSYFLA